MPDLQRLVELGIRRRALLAELDEVTAQIRPLAVAAVHAGRDKFYVARDASITRPSLDRWLKADRT